jgi:hypothetical protein
MDDDWHATMAQAKTTIDLVAEVAKRDRLIADLEAQMLGIVERVKLRRNPDGHEDWFDGYNRAIDEVLEIIKSVASRPDQSPLE